eukprot:UN19259
MRTFSSFLKTQFYKMRLCGKTTFENALSFSIC